MLNILRKFGELMQTEFGRDHLEMVYEALGHFKRESFEGTKHTEFVCRRREINISFPPSCV